MSRTQGLNSKKRDKEQTLNITGPSRVALRKINLKRMRVSFGWGRGRVSWDWVHRKMGPTWAKEDRWVFKSGVRGKRGGEAPSEDPRQGFWKQVQRGQVWEGGSLCVASLAHHWRLPACHWKLQHSLAARNAQHLCHFLPLCLAQLPLCPECP